MSPIPFVILAMGWAIWILSFIRVRRRGVKGIVDRRARIGILIQSAGYWLLFFNPFWERPIGILRLAGEIGFLTLGCALAVTALKALGKQWRIDAGLNEDHELIRSGPYQFVRHPLYLSMFCMLLASGCVVASKLILFASTLIFLAGTEIRVRIEDSLLASRFDTEFQEYRAHVRAYLPLIR